MVVALPVEIIGIVRRNNPLVIFGERGAGKTTFMYQLWISLISRGTDSALITSYTSARTLYHMFHPRLDAGGRDIIVVDNHSIVDRVTALSHVLDALGVRDNVAILMDDMMPLEFLIAPKISTEMARIFSRLLFWLNYIARILKVLIVCSVPENISKMLPFKARFFASYGFNFIHIFHQAHFRELSLVDIDESTGTVKRSIFARAIISKNGFTFG